jgi:hypothetical protein
MVRRLFPLVLALVVAAAPVALDVCQATCTAMAHLDAMPAAMSDGSGGHSCHEDVVTDGPVLTAAPHSCDHRGEDQPPASGVASAQRAIGAIPLAVIDSSLALPSNESTALGAVVSVVPRPPILLSAVPLRI